MTTWMPRSANDEQSRHQSYHVQARGHKYDGNATDGTSLMAQKIYRIPTGTPSLVVFRQPQAQLLYSGRIKPSISIESLTGLY